MYLLPIGVAVHFTFFTNLKFAFVKFSPETNRILAKLKPEFEGKKKIVAKSECSNVRVRLQQ